MEPQVLLVCQTFRLWNRCSGAGGSDARFKFRASTVDVDIDSGEISSTQTATVRFMSIAAVFTGSNLPSVSNRYTSHLGSSFTPSGRQAGVRRPV